MPPRARGGDPEERDGLLGYRHSAGAGDQVGGIGGGGEVHERLGSLGERGAVTDDEVEVALDGVAAVQNGLLRGFHAAHGDGLHGLVHGGQGGVADGVGVGGHGGDHLAGGGQLILVLAGVLGAGDGLEAVAGAGAGLTAHEDHLAVRAAHVGPVGDLAGGELGDLLHAEVGHGVVGVDDDGDAVLGHGDGLDAGFVILQVTGGQADVAGAVLGAGDAGAGTGAGVVHRDAGLHLLKALGQVAHHALHGGGAVGVDGAAQGCGGFL